MFRTICFTLLLVLSLGNLLRRYKFNQTDWIFILSLVLLLFSIAVILITGLKHLKSTKKAWRISAGAQQRFRRPANNTLK